MDKNDNQDSDDESSTATLEEIDDESDEEDWDANNCRPRQEKMTRNPNPRHTNARNTSTTEGSTREEAARDERHNLFSVEEMGVCYDHTEAQFMAVLMKKLMHEHDTEFAFAKQHLHHKGIKIFGEKGKK